MNEWIDNIRACVVLWALGTFPPVCRALTGPLTPTQRRTPCRHGQRRGQDLERGWVWTPLASQNTRARPLIKFLPPVSTRRLTPSPHSWISGISLLFGFFFHSFVCLSFTRPHVCRHTMSVQPRCTCISSRRRLLINKRCCRQPLHTLQSALLFIYFSNKHQLMLCFLSLGFLSLIMDEFELHPLLWTAAAAGFSQPLRSTRPRGFLTTAPSQLGLPSEDFCFPSPRLTRQTQTHGHALARTPSSSTHYDEVPVNVIGPQHPNTIKFIHRAASPAAVRFNV